MARARNIAVAVAVVVLAVLVAAALTGQATEPRAPCPETEVETVDHTEYFREANITRYEGSKSCIGCHYDEVVEFFNSYHYQMAVVIKDIAGKDSIVFGGRMAFNDYCMLIFLENGTKPLNWIGYPRLKNTPPGYEELKGEFIGLTGCSMCHGVSMGLPPNWEATREQLENIDCIACHVEPKTYLSGPVAIKKGLKNVTRDEKGRLRYVVLVDIDEIAKNIIDKPRAANCLACHAFSGGGPHLKRPNISPDLMDPEKAGEFDVHFKHGLTCIDCHPGKGHAFPTKSADTWSREEGVVRDCSTCHGEAPHGGLTGWFLNTFHDRVACQTCHIPYIAHGDYPTELWRDWSKATFLPEHKRWKFSIPDPETLDTSKWYLFSNIEPVYMWYNGTRSVYMFPEPVEPVKDPELELEPAGSRSLGVVYYVKPLGGKDDPESKIYPFRLHRAVIPYSTANKTPVPLKVGLAFITGDTVKAAKVGAKAAGIEWKEGDYITYVRYMQVNHGVQPKEKALWCLDCHGFTPKRMPWDELGYGYWPEIAFTGIVAGAVVAVGVSTYKLWRKAKK